MPLAQLSFLVFALLRVSHEKIAFIMTAVATVFFLTPAFILWKFPRPGRWISSVFFLVSALLTARAFVRVPQHTSPELLRAFIWILVLLVVSYFLMFGSSVKSYVLAASTRQPNRVAGSD